MNYQNFLCNTHAFPLQRWRALLEHYTPNVFYDIGSNNPYEQHYGALSYFRDLLPNTELYLFEPSLKHKLPLLLSGLKFNMDVLSDSDDKVVTFFESNEPNNDGGGDAYYRENTKYYDDEHVIKTERRTKTLDTVVTEQQWPLPDIIKLDIQGAELDVLKGASKCIDTCKFVLIECAVQQYNQGAPLIGEIITFMLSKGMTVYDVFQNHYHDNTLNQIDIMFQRNVHIIW